MNSRRVSKTLLFKQSFVNLLKLKSVLIILAAGLLLSGFIIFAVPQIFSSGIEAYYRLYINSSFWIEFLLQFTYGIIAVVGILIGILNYNKSEKIFILSKPITRRNFLWNKILTSAVVSLIFGFIVFLMHLIVFLLTIKDMSEPLTVVFRKNFNVVGFFFVILAIPVATCVIANSLSFFFHPIIAALIPLLLVVLYIVLSPYIIPLEENKINQLIYSSIAPLFYLPIAGICYGLTYLFFKKQRIEG